MPWVPVAISGRLSGNRSEVSVVRTGSAVASEAVVVAGVGSVAAAVVVAGATGVS